MWDSYDLKREMVDPKNLPPPLDQLRSNMAKAEVPGSSPPAADPAAAGNTQGDAKAPAAKVPPHSPGEGTHSAASGDPSQSGNAKGPSAAATGSKPGKAKAKSTSVTKRRRTCSAPPPSTAQPPAEPTPIDINRGWSTENTLLFAKWEKHYVELCEYYPSCTAEDAAGLANAYRTQLTEAQTKLDNQRYQAEEERKYQAQLFAAAHVPCRGLRESPWKVQTTGMLLSIRPRRNRARHTHVLRLFRKKCQWPIAAGLSRLPPSAAIRQPSTPKHIMPAAQNTAAIGRPFQK